MGSILGRFASERHRRIQGDTPRGTNGVDGPTGGGFRRSACAPVRRGRRHRRGSSVGRLARILELHGDELGGALPIAGRDPGIAGQVAKRLVLYVRRPGHQSQFSALLQAQARADSPFGGLIEWLQDHLDEALDVPALAARAGLGERTFHRRFRAATGHTPARFVEMARLDAARMLLSRGMSLKSVAARVGLFPVARFTQAFERRFGVGPRLYRDMHAGFDRARSGPGDGRSPRRP